MRHLQGEHSVFARNDDRTRTLAGRGGESVRTRQLEIDIVDLDRPGSGFRTIQLDFRVDGRKVDTRSLPVRVTHKVYGLVANRNLREGDFITEEDLTEGLIPFRDRSEDDRWDRSARHARYGERDRLHHRN